MKKPTKKHRRRKMPGDIQLSAMALQLSMLLDAGLGYPDIARSVLEGPAGRAAADEAYEKAKSGAALDEVLESTGLMPAYFTDMLGVGIETGKAPESAAALHLYYGRLGNLKARIRNAALQPMFMLASTMCVLAVILVKIFPVFGSAYQAAGMLPGAAMSAMLDFGSFLGAHWKPAVFCVVAAGAAVFAAWRLTGLGSAVLKILGRTRTGRAVSDAKFLQALSMGLDSGMGSIEALEMAAYTAGGGAQRFLACLYGFKFSLESGGWIGGALLDAGIIGSTQASILRSGLDAGSLPDAMNYVAGAAMDDAEGRISRFSGAIEPAVTLLGSALSVATILAAMLPLLESMSSIG